MTGNVTEWVADWFDASYYQYSVERNPKGADTGSTRVQRGGSWHNSPHNLRSTYRTSRRSDFRSDSYGGFRCARGAV